MKKLLIILITFFGVKPYNTSAQELFSLAQLDTITAYKSLKEALIKPEEVIKLILKGKKEIPTNEQLSLFTNLQYFSLKRAQLETIPTSINQLNKIQVLDLSNNKITSLPEELTECNNLKILHLGQNEIRSIPIEISNLENLAVLDLWSNNITSLPIEMSSMKNLKFIDLRVIMFSQEKQDELIELLPWVKFEFSYSCNCN